MSDAVIIFFTATVDRGPDAAPLPVPYLRVTYGDLRHKRKVVKKIIVQYFEAQTLVRVEGGT